MLLCPLHFPIYLSISLFNNKKIRFEFLLRASSPPTAPGSWAVGPVRQETVDRQQTNVTKAPVSMWKWRRCLEGKESGPACGWGKARLWKWSGDYECVQWRREDGCTDTENCMCRVPVAGDSMARWRNFRRASVASSRERDKEYVERGVRGQELDKYSHKDFLFLLSLEQGNTKGSRQRGIGGAKSYCYVEIMNLDLFWKINYSSQGLVIFYYRTPDERGCQLELGWWPWRWNEGMELEKYSQ